jgi:hypothetical protein
MKNIHLLPTDKSSRLYTYKGVLNFTAAEFVAPTIVQKNVLINLNTYIISNDEIKEEDWVIKISSIYKGGGIAQKYSFIDTQFEDIIFKKIILTTDQDLIKDGVQAIDDEFLEWFVKNPSCEEVKIADLWKDGNPSTHDMYQIIIPQEEPKQETHICKPKQETLEEAIKREYETRKFNSDFPFDPQSFKLGAKWQQERMYSEENMEMCWNASYIDATALDDINYKPLFFEDFIKQFKKK